eukprot:535177_1
MVRVAAPTPAEAEAADGEGKEAADGECNEATRGKGKESADCIEAAAVECKEAVDGEGKEAADGMKAASVSEATKVVGVRAVGEASTAPAARRNGDSIISPPREFSEKIGRNTA